MIMLSPNQERATAIDGLTALNELRERVSVVKLYDASDRIVDLTETPIENRFSFSNVVNKEESRANLLMLYSLRGLPTGAMGLWLSPPSAKYERGKMLLVVTRGRDGRREYVEYDYTQTIFSRDDFRRFVQKLENYRRDGYFLFEMPTWGLLQEAINMPVIWKGILSDYWEKEFDKNAEEIMMQNRAKGAAGMRQRIYEDTGKDIALACPSDSVSSVVNKLVSPEGKIKTFAKACGVCGREISDWIEKGYQCPHCGEVYLGVC